MREKRATAEKKRVNYYPFGLKHKGYNNNISSLGNSTAQKWDYLGQERQEELGLKWVTFRHRNADPTLGRFFGVDPVSEDYMSISTYQFAHNNPVWKIELEGLEGVETSGMDIPNGEPVRGHTNTGSMAIPIGDGTGNHGSAQRIITLSANISPSTEFRSGAFNDNDFVGNSVPATDAMYNTNPVGAVLKDVGYVLSNLTGVNAVDDAIAVANDPNSTKLDVAEAAVNVLMTGKGGKGKISKAGVTGHTKHGLNQSINRNGGRGVSAKAKASAIVNPKAKTEQSGGRTKYKGKKATVVTNSDGKIITTFGSSRSKISVPQGRSQGGGKAQRRNIKETGASYNPNQIR